jgi:hypothetical protein
VRWHECHEERWGGVSKTLGGSLKKKRWKNLLEGEIFRIPLVLIGMSVEGAAAQ